MALVLTSGCCWGLHGVLIKLGLAEGYSFAQIFMFEVAISSLFFGSFGKRFFQGGGPRGLAEWGWLVAIGIATVGLGNFLFLAFSLGPVAIGATLMFLYLPMVYGYSWLSGKEPLRGTKIFGICLILLGAVFATGLLNSLNEPGVLKAAGAAVLAACCYGAVFVLTPKVAVYSNLYLRSFMVCSIGLAGTVLLVLAYPSLWYTDGSLGARFWVLLFLLGGIGQILPVFTLMKGLPVVGGSLGGVLASIELPVAVFSAALVLNESLGWGRVFGVVLVFGGIAVFNFADRFEAYFRSFKEGASAPLEP